MTTATNGNNIHKNVTTGKEKQTIRPQTNKQLKKNYDNPIVTTKINISNTT